MMMEKKPVIAIVGGGQLGLMIAREAHDLGADVAVRVAEIVLKD